MSTAIDPRIETMPVKDIFKVIIGLCSDNKTEAASLLGLSRQRIDHIMKEGKKDQEVIDALERARRRMGMSKSSFWDVLTGAKKASADDID